MHATRSSVLLVLLLLTGATHATLPARANPSFAYNSDTGVRGHTGTIFTSSTVSRFEQAYDEVLSRAQDFVNGANSLTVKTLPATESTLQLSSYQEWWDKFGSRSHKLWRSENANAIAKIQRWPPSVEDCRIVCGEELEGPNGRLRSGTCQTEVLNAHSQMIEKMLSWPQSVPQPWLRLPGSVAPPYWTIGGKTDPIYLLNGLCTCRPGWGVDSDTEDAIYNLLDSPFTTWNSPDPAADNAASINGAVAYTGSGRVFMGTMITWEHFAGMSEVTTSGNVVMGYKLPLHCGHKIDNVVVRPNAAIPPELEMESSDLASKIQQCGHGSVDHAAASCLGLLGWSDIEWEIEGDLDLLTLKNLLSDTLSPQPVNLFTCLTRISDLNVDGFCECQHGYTDSLGSVLPAMHLRKLERPFDIVDLVPDDKKTLARQMNKVYSQASTTGCMHRFQYWFCAYSQTSSGLWQSARCDDYRVCGVTLDPRQRRIPYRVGITPGDYIPLSAETKAEVDTMFNNKADYTIKMNFVTRKPRSCATYFCDDPQHGTPTFFSISNLEIPSTCACVAPWTGEFCEINADDYFCSGHGVYDFETEKCTCDGDYWHDTATVQPGDVHQCARLCGDVLCNEHGTCNCVGTCANVTACDCDRHYTGATCDLTCASEHCNAHGNCTYPFTSCSCDPGFSGTNCHLSPRWEWCSGHGEPVDPIASPDAEVLCHCDDEYFGSDCSLYIGEDDDTCEVVLTVSHTANGAEGTWISTGNDRAPMTEP